jgi:hypothetical protein
MTASGANQLSSQQRFRRIGRCRNDPSSFCDLSYSPFQSVTRRIQRPRADILHHDANPCAELKHQIDHLGIVSVLVVHTLPVSMTASSS